MTYNEFLLGFYLSLKDPQTEQWRPGQTLINHLRYTKRSLYDRLMGSDTGPNRIDCFYNDEVIPNTLEWLKENWT